MASAKNQVIKGDYCNSAISSNFEDGIQIGMWSSVKNINKYTVQSYEVLNEDTKKSGTSAVLRAGVGAFALGPVGLLAGLSAKNKGIYLISIEFKDGKRSLIEIDEKLYKRFIESMF